jgi:CheY-like chemotaxis protein
MARVLVIDDEPDVRWLLRLSLERVGHEVLLAEDGLRGVAMAQRQRPDVIVLDLMMPVMDGYGVLEALAKDGRTSALPVLVLTAKAIPEEEARVTERARSGS